jgi:hypothetical protein
MLIETAHPVWLLGTGTSANSSVSQLQLNIRPCFVPQLPSIIQSTTITFTEPTLCTSRSFRYDFTLLACNHLPLNLVFQTETPYWQPNPAVPAPFTLNPAYNDPPLASGQTSAWSLAIQASSGIYAYGVNLYSFFSRYNQTCLNTYNCQQGTFTIDSASTAIYIYNFNTYVL